MRKALLGALLLAATVFNSLPAFAREPWTVTETGLWGEYVHSFRLTRPENPDHQYVFLAPRVGLALPKYDTLSLVVEPHLGYFLQVRQAWAGGANLLLDWRPLPYYGSWLPFFEIGGGVILTEYSKLYGLVNFELQFGLGAHYKLDEKTSLSLGWRFHHLSNGGIYLPNVGINGNMLMLGVSWLR